MLNIARNRKGGNLGGGHLVCGIATRGHGADTRSRRDYIREASDEVCRASAQDRSGPRMNALQRFDGGDRN